MHRPRLLFALVLATVAAGPPAAAFAHAYPIPDGLVSWWTGDNTADDAWDSNHGTLTSGAYDAAIVGDGFSPGARRPRRP